MTVEDRGQPHHVWIDARGGAHFVPVPVSYPQVVSVPIGWRMQSDGQQGVILRSVFGEVLTAHKAYQKAIANEQGFRLRSE